MPNNVLTNFKLRLVLLNVKVSNIILKEKSAEFYSEV